MTTRSSPPYTATLEGGKCIVRNERSAVVARVDCTRATFQLVAEYELGKLHACDEDGARAQYEERGK